MPVWPDQDSRCPSVYLSLLCGALQLTLRQRGVSLSFRMLALQRNTVEIKSLQVMRSDRSHVSHSKSQYVKKRLFKCSPLAYNNYGFHYIFICAETGFNHTVPHKPPSLTLTPSWMRTHYYTCLSDRFDSLLFIHFKILLCVWGACLPQHTCAGQRTDVRSLSFRCVGPSDRTQATRLGTH